jgi:Sulfotransferase domain
MVSRVINLWRAAALVLLIYASSLLATTLLVVTDEQVAQFHSVHRRQNQLSLPSISLTSSSLEKRTLTAKDPTPGSRAIQIENSTFVTSDARITTKSKTNARVNETDSGPWPRIAWLMSFPNSGTSYTSQLVKHLTKTKTASNYGEQNPDKHGNSVPVYTNDWNGPYYVDPNGGTRDYDIPTRYILTKTHCGGYNANSPPEGYVESTHSFRRRCLATRYTIQNGTLSLRGEYHASRVRKAIHLFRNPFDNIVSRFNMEQNRLQKEQGGKNHTSQNNSPLLFTKSRDGFRAFCKQTDEMFKDSERNSLVYDESMLAIMEKVPCHADFVRYVEWHNMAFVMTKDLGIETMILHYEEYGSHFQETTEKLLYFLELRENGIKRPFVAGRVYANVYFTENERQAVKEILKMLALRTTWEYIKHYFV